MELLSPAGTLECGIAALHYGADAIYLGMKDFSARADAGNFSFEDLSVLLGLAHGDKARPRKVYVAVNTLVHDSELPAMAECLARLQDAGVDAIIVQDAAVAELARNFFPALQLHASTQMAVHNAAGVRQARREGFSRVVAARELSMQELAEMAAVPGMEIEAFIHGALCYSYSGLCLMSAMLNGESGNRGSCAYVCRNRFELKERDGGRPGQCCPMSMKDLALGELLPELERAGVKSLKIEGRKKTPLYVAAVTRYYRKLLDGSFKPGEELQAELDVKTIFSRPWTGLFARSPRAVGVTDPLVAGPRGIEAGVAIRVRRLGDKDFLRFTVKTRPIEKHDGLQVELPGMDRPYGFGVSELYAFPQSGQDRREAVFSAPPGTTVETALPDGHPAIPAGSRVFCGSSQAVKARYSWPEARPSLMRQRRPAAFKVVVEKSAVSAYASASSPGSGICNAACSMPMDAPLQKAQRPENVQGDAERCFERLGDSGFSLGALELENPEGLYVPKSILNELRRKAVAALEDALEGNVAARRSAAVDYAASWHAPQTGRDCICILKTDRLFLLNSFGRDDLDAISELVLAPGHAAPEKAESMLAEATELLGGASRIRISLPAVLRSWEAERWLEEVRRLRSMGWRRWELGNIGAFDLLESAGYAPGECGIAADWPLYSMNTVAARHFIKMGAEYVTACPEDSPGNVCGMAASLGDRLAVGVVQDTALARSAACIMASTKGSCPGRQNCGFTRMEMRNARGDTLLAVNDDCMSVILGASPLDLTWHMPDFLRAGIRRFRAEFLWRDHAPTEVRAAWRRMLENLPARQP